MSTAALGSTEVRRALAFHGDGLLDIFLGLTLLDAWTVLRDPLGAASGGAIVILFPLVLVAKRAITVPRLSPTSPEPPRRKTLSRANVLVVAVTTLLLVLGTDGLLAPSVRAAPLPHAWDLVALVGLGLVAAAGVRLRAWRFVVYAGLATLTVGLGLHEQRGAVTYLTPALTALMVGWGGVLLARFVAANPYRVTSILT